MNNSQLNIWHQKSNLDIESTLERILDRQCSSPTLINSIKYSTLAGGKRIRPLLTIAGGMLSNANYQATLEIGAALEMIHCFSLIHDDLPIMDNDDLRRGKPTNHKVYGDAIALLAGDALQALCFEILCSSLPNLTAEKKLAIIHKTSHAIGLNGMVGGQAIDWLSSGKNLSQQELQLMHTLKTGALLSAAIMTGYIAGDNYNSNSLIQIEEVSNKIGLLFQIVDDIIDVTESTETLGKTANKDLQQNKATYVNILGLEQSKILARNLHQEINLLLNNHKNSETLQYLTDIIYSRNN